jgi:hypothetical protein
MSRGSTVKGGLIHIKAGTSAQVMTSNNTRHPPARVRATSRLGKRCGEQRARWTTTRITRIRAQMGTIDPWPCMVDRTLPTSGATVSYSQIPRSARGTLATGRKLAA